MINIFVGNLGFRTTEEKLRKAFEVYGQVDKVDIVTHKESGQPRGFAFGPMVPRPHAAPTGEPQNPVTSALNGYTFNVDYRIRCPVMLHDLPRQADE
jgi:RNA recognition motif-containing protein